MRPLVEAVENKICSIFKVCLADRPWQKLMILPRRPRTIRNRRPALHWQQHLVIAGRTSAWKLCLLTWEIQVWMLVSTIRKNTRPASLAEVFTGLGLGLT